MYLPLNIQSRIDQNSFYLINQEARESTELQSFAFYTYNDFDDQ